MPARLDCIDDPAMPALATVLDPIQLGKHLHQSCPFATDSWKGIQVRLLRYHPGKRCVFEITLRTPKGPLGMIGKVYAKDRCDVFKLMNKVSTAGFGPSETFSIPQADAYVQPLRLLLQERFEGRPATESFLSEDESERELAATRCACWLAKFHGIALRMGRSFEFGAYLESLEQWSRRLAVLGEPFAGKAGAIFKHLQAAEALLHSTNMCTIHGDFTHHQVLFLQRRTVTVDWDSYALADPIRDLARFTVGLKRLALRSLGSICALDHAAEVFLKTYVCIDRSDRPAQLAFHKAAVCLEHAKHDVHKQASGWRERAQTTLDEGLRILERGE